MLQPINLLYTYGQRAVAHVKPAAKTLFVILMVVGLMTSAGCDLGTYNKRLEEVPAAPSDEPADNNSESDDDSTDDGVQ